MKKIFLLLILFTAISCEKDTTAIIALEKVFDPQQLPNLDLEKLNSFWDDDSIISIEPSGANHFTGFNGFLDGSEVFGENKVINVSVFESKSMAIDAMEQRRNLVAILIYDGYPNNIFNGIWWYAGEDAMRAIFLNEWNTIIEIRYRGSYIAEDKEELMKTVAKVAKRIDSLSS
jgi:hypothetical protein